MFDRRRRWKWALKIWKIAGGTPGNKQISGGREKTKLRNALSGLHVTSIPYSDTVPAKFNYIRILSKIPKDIRE